MAKSKLPTGIYEVSWRNKIDRRIQIRYRVKVTRKAYEADQLFDTLEEAETFLNNLHSPAGREKMAEEQQAKEKLKQWMLDKLSNPDVGWYLNKYFKTYVEPEYPDEEIGPIKSRSKKTLEYIKEAIKKTEIEVIPKDAPGEMLAARFGKLREAKFGKKVKFGDMKLVDVDGEAASAYIRTRCSQVAPSTVLRELSMIGSMYSKLRFIDKRTWELIGKQNPFVDADRTPLKRVRQGRNEEAGRLDKDAEDRLFAALAATKRRGFKEPSTMLQIVALALVTGMRRGEVLELEWSRVKDDRIVLRSIDTKTGSPRWIPLSTEAKAILATVPRDPEKAKVFSYSPDGFSANWRRVRAKAVIPEFRFHDTRREFISRCLDQINNISPVVLAKQVGIASVAHLEKAYIEPHSREKVIEQGIRSQRDVMRVVGHTQQSTTSRYYARLQPTQAEDAAKHAEVAAGSDSDLSSVPDQAAAIREGIASGPSIPASEVFSDLTTRYDETKE